MMFWRHVCLLLVSEISSILVSSSSSTTQQSSQAVTSEVTSGHVPYPYVTIDGGLKVNASLRDNGTNSEDFQFGVGDDHIEKRGMEKQARIILASVLSFGAVVVVAIIAFVYVRRTNQLNKWLYWSFLEHSKKSPGLPAGLPTDKPRAISSKNHRTSAFYIGHLSDAEEDPPTNTGEDMDANFILRIDSAGKQNGTVTSNQGIEISFDEISAKKQNRTPLPSQSQASKPRVSPNLNELELKFDFEAKGSTQPNSDERSSQTIDASTPEIAKHDDKSELHPTAKGSIQPNSDENSSLNSKSQTKIDVSKLEIPKLADKSELQPTAKGSIQPNSDENSSLISQSQTTVNVSKLEIPQHTGKSELRQRMESDNDESNSNSSSTLSSLSENVTSESSGNKDRIEFTGEKSDMNPVGESETSEAIKAIRDITNCAPDGDRKIKAVNVRAIISQWNSSEGQPTDNKKTKETEATKATSKTMDLDFSQCQHDTEQTANVTIDQQLVDSTTDGQLRTTDNDKVRREPDAEHKLHLHVKEESSHLSRSFSEMLNSIDFPDSFLPYIYGPLPAAKPLPVSQLPFPVFALPDPEDSEDSELPLTEGHAV